MGLFSTTLHVYNKNQSEVVQALGKLFEDKVGVKKIDRIAVTNETFRNVMDSEIYSKVI
jgi:hypothetical protein